MSLGPIGAGAGVRRKQPFFRQPLRPPTEEEKKEIQSILDKLEDILEEGQSGPEELNDFLYTHRDVRINDVYSSRNGETYYKDTLNVYGILMLSPHVDIDDETLYEVMRRRPDPFKISGSAPSFQLADALQEEIDMAEEDGDVERKELFERKLKVANDYTKRQYVKNLNSITKTSKNFFGEKGLGSNMEEKILGFITNESGTLPIQLSKYRTKAGLPGVPNKSPTGGGKSQKRRKSTRKMKKSRRRH